MRYSVVIPAHNEARHLDRLLPALIAGFQRTGVAVEVIVVANGCTDTTVETCKRHGVQCVECDLAYAGRARNIGASVARAPTLVFLDADVLPSEGWFATLMARATELGRDWVSGLPVRVPPEAGWVATAWQAVRLHTSPSYINSANCIVDAGLFHRLRGFDEAKRSGEDVDFSLRARAARARLSFDAGLVVFHHGEPSGLVQFFARQRFHAEAFPAVLAGITRSPTNVLIVAVFLAWTVSMASALTLMFGGPSGCGIALPAGPFVTLVAGGVKARSPLAKLPGETSWPAMLTVSSVMFLARAVGMVRPLRGWRTGS